MGLERIVLYYGKKNIFGKWNSCVEDEISAVDGIEKKHVLRAVAMVADHWQTTATARFEYSDGTSDVIQANSEDKENGVLQWTHVVSWNSRDAVVRIPIGKFRRMVYKKMGD